jgi:hypothetical protein
MTHLKDFVCINGRGHAVRVVLALERHLHLQCDGCGEQSAISERRASVRDLQLSQPNTRARRSKPRYSVSGVDRRSAMLHRKSQRRHTSQTFPSTTEKR